MLRNLYFYLDLDFVKEELIDIYRHTADKELKTVIKKLHDGSLDVDDLVKMAKENEKLFAESKPENYDFSDNQTTTNSEEELPNVFKYYSYKIKENDNV